MNNNQTITFKSNKRLIGILVCVIVLLLIPLIAMQVSSNVKWSLLDFIAAGILLLSTGLALEVILRKVKITRFRIMACVVLFLLFFLIWAELAVGIFGTPFGGN